MSTLAIVALVLGGVLVFALIWVLCAAAVLIPVRRRARRLSDELERQLGDAVKKKANAQGLGLESRGKAQARGNGWLVLTADELRFRQWFPDRETVIPLAAITAVETPRAWLGKTVGSKLLCVRWHEPDGGADAMAWNLSDRDEWLALLGERA